MSSRGPMEPGEGERLHAEKRKQFWKLLGGLALIGMALGFVGGFVTGHADARGAEVSAEFKTIGAAGVVLLAILAAYASWRFFVSVDEVEVADNLWGSLIGFYTYAILFPLWWALAELDQAPEPDDWVIFITSMIVATAAYGVRKWRSR